MTGNRGAILSLLTLFPPSVIPTPKCHPDPPPCVIPTLPQVSSRPSPLCHPEHRRGISATRPGQQKRPQPAGSVPRMRFLHYGRNDKMGGRNDKMGGRNDRRGGRNDRRGGRNAPLLCHPEGGSKATESRDLPTQRKKLEIQSPLNYRFFRSANPGPDLLTVFHTACTLSSTDEATVRTQYREFVSGGPIIY